MPGRVSAGLAAIAAIVLVFLGLAVFALPTQCVPGLPGSWGCLANDTALPAVAAAQPKAATGAASLSANAPPTAAAGAAPQPAASPAAAANAGLIDATFAQLQQGSGAPAPGTAPAAARAAAAQASAAPPQSGAEFNAPTTRMVSTMVIRADPQTGAPLDPPQTPAADPAATAAPATEPAAAPAPAVAATIAPADPVPMDPPVARPATDDSIRIVGGGGVTVRSGPSRSRAKMFALGPGEKVTVTGTQRGWVAIVDAQGRRGWAYSSYLAKP
jgi:hypothetical protein